MKHETHEKKRPLRKASIDTSRYFIRVVRTMRWVECSAAAYQAVLDSGVDVQLAVVD